VKFCPPTDVFKYCVDNRDADGRLRLPKPIRKSIYQWFYRRLKDKPALCKETDDLVKDLNFSGPCNCML
jgi:hypothetical protein